MTSTLFKGMSSPNKGSKQLPSHGCLLTSTVESQKKHEKAKIHAKYTGQTKVALLNVLYTVTPNPFPVES